MRKLYTFINVDPNFIIPSKDEQNYYYDRKIYRNLIKIIGTKNTGMIAKQLPKNFKSIFKQKKRNVKEAPKLREDTRRLLWEIYKDDIAELEKITGRDLSHWQPGT